MKIDFKTLPSNPLNGGIQYKGFFPNGYGISVIKHNYSYGSDSGLWEVAVLCGTEEKCSITYTTPITDDVIGYLSEEEVNEILEKIELLPKK